MESGQSQEVFELTLDPDTLDGPPVHEDRHVTRRKPAVTTIEVEREGRCFDSDPPPPPHEIGDPLLEPMRGHLRPHA